MDLDKAFVFSLLREGKDLVQLAQDKGVRPEYLAGDGKIAYEFALEYASKYGVMPTTDVITGRTGVVLEERPEPAAFFIDEVMNRNLHLRVMEGLRAPLGLLEKAQPVQAVEALESLLHELRQQQLVTSRIEPLTSLGAMVLDRFERIKRGERGILFPWKTLNDDTLGMWPEDLVVFVARTSVGKSWTAIMTARSAWQQGKRVLFATTEMSKDMIASRFFAIHFNLPYGALRSGTLTAFAEARFRKGVEEIAGADGLYVVGGDFDYRVESFEAAIEQAKPDLAVLDGAYLLKVAGASRTDQAANAFNELKRLAKRYKIPILTTTQFNREVKTNVANSVKIESMALTDVAAWNASLIVALVQTPDMKGNNEMILKTIKSRESSGSEFNIKWNMELMEFGEEGPNGALSDADEFGTNIVDPTTPDGFDLVEGDEVPF